MSEGAYYANLLFDVMIGWVVNRKKKTKTVKEREERRGKVILPYTKGISEKLGRIFKRYDIETIHKPSTTIKNLLCNKMKDKVELLDKTGCVYYNDCKKHKEPRKNDYVGETDRVLRKRLYEHRIIDHKTANQAASLDTKVEEQNSEEDQGTRRSSRLRDKKKKDYKAVQEGSDQMVSEGNTEFSAHIASDTHSKEDLEYKVLCTEEKWFRRGVKEAIYIRKLKPTLNADEGRYQLTHMFDKLIRSSAAITNPSHGAQDGYWLSIDSCL